MIRKHLSSFVIGTLSLLGILGATPSLAADNCVMSIDYAALPEATLERIYRDIHLAVDIPVISKSMKCSTSLTYSKLTDEIVDQLTKGKSPVINMAPTMELYSPNYASLSDEAIRNYGGW